MRPIRIALVVLAVLAVPLAASAAFRASGSPNVSFSATGPVGMRIDGSTHDLSVIDDGTHVTVRVGLRTLSTGIDLRDRHMRDRYLEVGRFPNAELVVERSALRVPTTAPVSGNARGTFRLHGRTRPVQFRYEARRQGTSIRVTGRASIDMTQYGIEAPSYMGVTVRSNVDINVRFAVSDQ